MAAEVTMALHLIDLLFVLHQQEPNMNVEAPKYNPGYFKSRVNTNLPFDV
jgi:hypothetical protein